MKMDLSYRDSKRRTGDPRFWNRNAPTHYKAVVAFACFSFPAGIITGTAAVWVYLPSPNRDYATAAAIMLIGIVGSWAVYLGMLTWAYYKLVMLSHLPPPAPPTPCRKIRVFANGKEEYYDLVERGRGMGNE